MGGTGTRTLVFTDLVASTELPGRLGDEGADRLRRTHFGLLREDDLSRLLSTKFVSHYSRGKTEYYRRP